MLLEGDEPGDGPGHGAPPFRAPWPTASAAGSSISPKLRMGPGGDLPALPGALPGVGGPVGGGEKARGHSYGGSGGGVNAVASLVVCSVDGTVYTLDAHTGRLRGLFSSGPPLVQSGGSDGDFGAGAGDADREDGEEGPSADVVAVSSGKGWRERVVPGLDGRLYSLFEMDEGDADGDDEDYLDGECEVVHDLDGGECRKREPYGEDNGDSSEDGIEGEASSSSAALPGFGTYKLTPLPISATDLVDAPISTCRPVTSADGSDDDARQQCGVIVGSKRTTIYAVDPTSGSVRWVQDPDGGGGGRGYTSHPPPERDRGRGEKSVLLQREDYTVGHLDMSSGREVWTVKLGRYSALDFDLGEGGGGGGDARDHRHHSSSDDDDDDDERDFDDRELSIVSRGRRGGAAAAASLDSKRNEGLPNQPLGGSKRRRPLHEHDEADLHGRAGGGGGGGRARSRPLAFPSVAFGEDGTTVMAVDAISGELLWRRRIDSVVAAVYGAGGEGGGWVPLDVVDEGDVLRADGWGAQQHRTDAAAASSGGLVPFGDSSFEDGGHHRLGRHRSSLFVSSTFDAATGDYPDENDEAEAGPNLLPHGYHLEESGGFEAFPFHGGHAGLDPTLGFGPLPPLRQSHRTEHGLYLTWTMVGSIAVIVLSAGIYARLKYVRQKRKFENTPSLDPTVAQSSEGRTKSGSGDFGASLDGLALPPVPIRTTAASSFENRTATLFSRSFSLGAMGSSSGNGLADRTNHGNNNNLPLSQLVPPASEAGKSPSHATRSTAATNTNSTPATRVARSQTLPSPEHGDGSLPGAATDSKPARPRGSSQSSDDGMDGVPLVRYSRYTTEFRELEPVGRGGFGSVFRVRNELDGREYAVKKIRISSRQAAAEADGGGTVTIDKRKLDRVLREVKILALLDHPNIVRYYTAWLEADSGAGGEDESTANASGSNRRGGGGFFSSSIFGGFSASTRAMAQQHQSPFRSRSSGGVGRRPPSPSPRHSRGGGGILNNPLGWNNNFGIPRLDESASSSGTPRLPSAAGACQEEDLGFSWERSGDASGSTSAAQLSSSPRKKPAAADTIEEEKDGESAGSSSSSSGRSGGISSVDSDESSDSSSTATTTTNPAAASTTAVEPKREGDNAGSTASTAATAEVRVHILFIQMQLCSVQTLADFLGDKAARRGEDAAGVVGGSSPPDGAYAVDIPRALRIFGQICKGVCHVHEQGLIHREFFILTPPVSRVVWTSSFCLVAPEPNRIPRSPIARRPEAAELLHRRRGHRQGRGLRPEQVQRLIERRGRRRGGRRPLPALRRRRPGEHRRRRDPRVQLPRADRGVELRREHRHLLARDHPLRAPLPHVHEHGEVQGVRRHQEAVLPAVLDEQRPAGVPVAPPGPALDAVARRERTADGRVGTRPRRGPTGGVHDPVPRQVVGEGERGAAAPRRGGRDGRRAPDGHPAHKGGGRVGRYPAVRPQGQGGQGHHGVRASGPGVAARGRRRGGHGDPRGARHECKADNNAGRKRLQSIERTSNL